MRFQKYMNWFRRSRRSSLAQRRIPRRLELEILEDRVVPSLNAASWTPLGPAPIVAFQNFSGRIAAVVANPTDPNLIYIGAAGGGVWKTSDGGTNWTPLTDNQATLFMGALALAPSNPNIIYAGTGEANLGPSKLVLNRDNIYAGRGILKSIDGGTTWTLLLGDTWQFYRRSISKIVVDPTNPNTVYVAVGALATNGLPGNTGIWKSTNGGTTWIDATAGISTTAAFSDVVMDPGNNLVLYAAVGDPNGGSANGLYKTTDGGSTWARAGSFPSGATDANVGRITVAIAKTAPGTLYASIAHSGAAASLYQMMKSTDGGATWALLSVPMNYLGIYGDYDTTLAVDPSNPLRVYAGGTANGTADVIESTDGGQTWTAIGGEITIHGDEHGIAFDADGRLLVGNDGGIWRLDNPAPSQPQWTDLNGNLQITQFTGVALAPTDPNTAYGGSQDNGTEKFQGSLNWNVVEFGDGGFVRVDPANPNTVYHSFQRTSDTVGYFLRRSDNGGVNWSTKTTGIGTTEPSDFYPPYVIDPSNPNRLLLGTDRVYETTNKADQWNAISSPGSNGWTIDSPIDALAVAASNGQTVYATANGRIFVTLNDGTSWADVSIPGFTDHFSGLAVDPTNNLIAYAVRDRFRGGSVPVRGGHVFRTSDGGLHWTDISATLPDTPTNAIVIDPRAQVLYVGTDQGVYSSVNGGAFWAPFGTGLPNVRVVDLEMSTKTNILAAATHGRGLWEILVYPPLFGPAAFSNVGQTPFGLASADFNGDGHPDLVAVNQNSASISILLNNGDGSFRSGQTISFGSLLTSVATGDFNHDGKMDIAVADEAADTVDILLGNGDGTFQAPRSFAAGPTPYVLATGDFNRDGNLDLVVVNGESLSLLKGNGDGTFQPPQAIVQNLVFAQSVAVADLNNDGNLDLVVPISDPQGAGSLLVLLGHGDGTFTTAADYASASGYAAVTVGDFNLDGKPDVAVTSVNSTVAVYLGNGDGSLQNPVSYAVAGLPLAIAAADFNADGEADLVTADLLNNTVTVLLNQGNGTFVVNRSYVVGNTPQWVIAGDWNGDGLPDLAVTDAGSNDVAVLTNQSPEKLGVTASQNAAAGQPITITVTALSQYNNTVPGYTHTIHFTSSDPRATLPADYTFGPADQGVHTFQVTFRTLGLQGLTATDIVSAAIAGSLRSSLTTLFATGVSGPGALLAGGAVDPHYQLVASSDPGNPGPNAYVVNPGWPLAPAGPWLADGPNSLWIAPFASNAATAAPGDYSYQTTFDLGGFDPSTVQITGQWATDNAGLEIDLNGVNTGIRGTSVTGYAQWQPFTIHSGFGAGVNTLVFKVNNAGTTPNPTGLRVELSGTAAGVVVQPGPARAFVLTGLPGTSGAGTAQKFTVTAEDPAGNPVPGYTGKVHFTSSDPHAALPADYTFTAADMGTHQFTVALKTAGPQTVTVSGNDLPAGAVSSWKGDNTAQDSIGGNNGSLQAGATYAAGEVNQAFSFAGTGDYFQAPTAGLPIGSGDRTLELWVNAQGLSAAEAFLAGYGNFGTAGQTYQLGLSGDTLFFSQWGQELLGPALSLGVWHHVAVTNIGDSVKLYLDGVAVASGTLGINTASGTQIYMGSIPGSLGGSRRLLGLTDEVTVYNRALGAQEIQDIYLNGSAGKFQTNIGNASVTVSSAAAKTLSVTGLPASTLAGTAVSFTVTAHDAYGNVATGYRGTIHFTSTDLQAVLPANYTFTAADKGAHTFTKAVTFKTAGTQTLTGKDTATTTITGKASEKVAAAAATHFVITAPSTPTVGVAFTITVTAEDAYGNTATSYRGTIHFICTDPLATLPKDYTFTATSNGRHSFSVTLRTAGTQTIDVDDVIDLAIKGSVTVTI